MNRKLWLMPAAFLCLAMTAGCTADSAAPAQDDAASEETELERVWQNIEVRVTVPSDVYRFRVNGRCGLEGQAIYAEGTSKNAEFSVHVSKDARMGLAVFFSNRDDEWEAMLAPADDTSEIDDNNVFRFTGEVPRNRDESNLERLDMRLRCTAF